mgnify:FL=1
MKRLIILLFIMYAPFAAKSIMAQNFALKTDLVKWGTASFNIEP